MTKTANKTEPVKKQAYNYPLCFSMIALIAGAAALGIVGEQKAERADMHSAKTNAPAHLKNSALKTVFERPWRSR